MAHLLRTGSRNAEEVILIHDNLNTHIPGAFSEAFPAEISDFFIRYEWDSDFADLFDGVALDHGGSPDGGLNLELPETVGEDETAGTSIVTDP